MQLCLYRIRQKSEGMIALTMEPKNSLFKYFSKENPSKSWAGLRLGKCYKISLLKIEKNGKTYSQWFNRKSLRKLTLVRVPGCLNFKKETTIPILLAWNRKIFMTSWSNNMSILNHILDKCLG